MVRVVLPDVGGADAADLRLRQTRSRHPSALGRPVAFHVVTAVAVSAVAPTVACALFCLVWRGETLAVLLGPSLPFWAPPPPPRAVTDPITYWMILAAGFALRALDENRERDAHAADMRRALVAAQVEALKMKLQPHFLFNTLNSISFLAVEKDVDGVVSMVERLGRAPAVVDAGDGQPAGRPSARSWRWPTSTSPSRRSGSPTAFA